MARTGYKGYATLEEYDTVTGLPTGETKPNVEGDPDYVAPVEDLSTCPIDESYVKIFQVYTKGDMTITIDSNLVNYKLIVKDGLEWTDDTHFETPLSNTTSPQVLTITGGVSSIKAIFIQVDLDNYAAIKAISVFPYTINAAFMNSFTGLETLSLPSETTVPSQNLSQLDIVACVALKVLLLTNSRLPLLNLTTNTLVENINIGDSINLSSLTIGSYSNLKTLTCHNCKFTAVSASSVIIDGIINGFNTAVVGPVVGYLLKYGANNSSGVQPGSNSYSNYVSLINKGVAITGKPPISKSAYLVVGNVNVLPDAIYFNLILSLPLSVDINVSGQIDYDYSGGQTSQSFSKVIFAGQTNVLTNVTPDYPDPTNPYVLIQNVIPNPAGGIVINY